MKPGDVLIVSYPNGIEFSWRVVGVHLGGVNEESVIEVDPIDQRPNLIGSTLIPAPLLDALTLGGSVVVREAVES